MTTETLSSPLATTLQPTPQTHPQKIGMSHMLLLKSAMHWDGRRWFKRLEKDGSDWYLDADSGFWVRKESE